MFTEPCEGGTLECVSRAKTPTLSLHGTFFFLLFFPLHLHFGSAGFLATVAYI